MKIWEKIVILRPNEKNKWTLEVNDLKAAARVLLEDWPALRGKSYRRAVLSCSAAIDGRAPHDAAQWAFIVALMEAAIPYEIIDWLDAEIAAVCRELLEAEGPVKQSVELVRPEAPTPVFWWPSGAAVRQCGIRGRSKAVTPQV